ncbi:MAG: ferritin [Nanoarchaeota archaeon]|nr:ferritin [Nanoarchaeota archaeon]
MIKDKVAKAINKQINAELYSSYLYLSMSAHFASVNFMGFSNWMKIQSQEERVHAMKFYEYLIERGGRVVLSAIDAPKTDWKSHLAAFEEVYAHELKVTSLINDLLKVAKAEEDSATAVELHWFINEQVEEEANALAIVEKLKLIKDSTNGLFMLDHELGERK